MLSLYVADQVPLLLAVLSLEFWLQCCGERSWHGAFGAKYESWIQKVCDCPSLSWKDHLIVPLWESFIAPQLLKLWHSPSQDCLQGHWYYLWRMKSSSCPPRSNNCLSHRDLLLHPLRWGQSSSRDCCNPLITCRNPISLGCKVGCLFGYVCDGGTWIPSYSFYNFAYGFSRGT